MFLIGRNTVLNTFFSKNTDIYLSLKKIATYLELKNCQKSLYWCLSIQVLVGPKSALICTWIKKLLILGFRYTQVCAFVSLFLNIAKIYNMPKTLYNKFFPSFYEFIMLVSSKIYSEYNLKKIMPKKNLNFFLFIYNI